MSIILKMLLDDNKTMLKQENKIRLEKYLEDIFDILYNQDNSDEFYQKKIDELNNFSEELYKEINKIDLSVNVLNISNKIISDDCNGTDIETLLKIRQEEEMNKIINNFEEN